MSISVWPETPTGPRRKSRALAVLLSLIAPGSGHDGLAHDRRRGSHSAALCGHCDLCQRRNGWLAEIRHIAEELIAGSQRQLHATRRHRKHPPWQLSGTELTEQAPKSAMCQHPTWDADVGWG